MNSIQAFWTLLTQTLSVIYPKGRMLSLNLAANHKSSLGSYCLCLAEVCFWEAARALVELWIVKGRGSVSMWQIH